MKLTREMITAHHPCTDGLLWYDKHGCDDLRKTLIDVNVVNPRWASWLYIRLMSKPQRVELAIFAAEQVLPIFERKYTEDKRPFKAIEAAKNWLIKQNDAAAYAAAAAAAAARKEMQLILINKAMEILER
jgi:hypothetical protein